MKNPVEAAVFLGIATAIHAGLWLSFGVELEAGSGSTTTSSISLRAAAPSTADMVERWNTAPEVAFAPTRSFLPIAPATQDFELSAPVPAQPTTSIAPEKPGLPVPDHAPPDIAVKAPEPLEPVRPRLRPERSVSRAPEAAPADQDRRQDRAAAGSRQPQNADQSQTGRTRAVSSGQLKTLEAQWGAAILARIARYQRYPAGTRSEGTAHIQLAVGRDGRLQTVGVIRSSGDPILDQAAVAAVRRAGIFPAAPSGLTKTSYSFQVPMTFRRN